MNRSISFALKLGLGLGILALIVYFVDLGDTLRALHGADPGWLLLSLACYVSTRVLMGVKWWVLLGGRGETVSYATVQRALLLSDYHGLLFPNTLAIDALRAVLLRHHPRGWTHTAASIVADRVINIAVAALVALLALAVSTLLVAHPFTPRVTLAVLAISGSIVAAALAVASQRLFDLVITVLHAIAAHGPLKGVVGRVLRKLGELHGAMRTMLTNPQVVVQAVLLAVLLVLMRCLSAYFVFRAIGTPVGFGWILTLMPVITTIALLPLTLFGLGLKDGAFVFFFSGIGVAASAALAVSFVTYALIIVTSVVLGLLASVIGPPLPVAAKGEG
ncbi:MAG: flippase-like domain-containing protein [Geminicoccaceae bacterium]|nr:flippase-like domain-containing protein [Geminicoccaceae bacterium]MCB9967785.1 flippase-like domain-containing protein [Geminicoccaceae bacterium]HRY24150.1 lysylphosphatidylglycerol synthase transmembrane domain-containing protein [Geminicoccaceae bacterium]